jgi:cellulose synthase/poly-beta-1,6-N-acetylglucosamine synthase-like glycosyltransferase
MPRVSIIVPARDEAHNLPHLLASLAALDPPAHEVIVVDDHSQDGTAEVAAAAGALVIGAPPLPEGWRGKCWACHAGAAVAAGDVLLFTDADTRHAPGSLARAVAALQAEGSDLVTIVPTHLVVSAWERLQAVFQLLLLVATGGRRHYAIGQYLLFRRDVYRAIGGHAAVRHLVAEDLGLAELVARRGGRRSVLVAPDLLEVRMYPEGFAGFWRGWQRSFRAGMPTAGLRGIVAVTLAIGWLLGAPLALAVAVATHDAPRALVALVACAAAVACVAHRQRLVGRFGAASALAYPIFTLVFVAVTLASAAAALARRPITWRGRSFRVESPSR